MNSYIQIDHLQLLNDFPFQRGSYNANILDIEEIADTLYVYVASCIVFLMKLVPIQLCVWIFKTLD